MHTFGVVSVEIWVPKSIPTIDVHVGVEYTQCVNNMLDMPGMIALT